MNQEQVPATEAQHEANAYELAFHVLPTVAEGEVASVVDTIKSHITTAGGEITAEEAPARFELAYEIIKHLEGRNRKFASAYFGWIRFTVDSSTVEEIATEVDTMKEILRSLTIKLTKVEEANPFMFHESIDQPKVETVDIEEDTETDEAESEDDTADAGSDEETDTEETEAEAEDKA